MESFDVNINLNSNLTIDDVCKIRVLNASTTVKTEQLRNECNDFVESKYSSVMYNCTCYLHNVFIFDRMRDIVLI